MIFGGPVYFSLNTSLYFCDLGACEWNVSSCKKLNLHDLRSPLSLQPLLMLPLSKAPRNLSSGAELQRAAVVNVSECANTKQTGEREHTCRVGYWLNELRPNRQIWSAFSRLLLFNWGGGSCWRRVNKTSLLFCCSWAWLLTRAVDSFCESDCAFSTDCVSVICHLGLWGVGTKMAFTPRLCLLQSCCFSISFVFWYTLICRSSLCRMLFQN